MSDWTAVEGSPLPLGITWVESAQAWNFALYSKHAESVTLLLYAEADLVHPVFTYRLDYPPEQVRQDLALSGRACRRRRGSLYAYSVAGPAPQGRFEWHSFDPEKVLLDPYAKSVFFSPTFDRAAASRPGSNVGKAPLGLVSRRRRRVRLGRGPAAPTRVRRCHLRIARSRVHEQPELRRESGAARHLRGAGREDPLSQGSGRHRGGTHARFSVRSAGGNYWGYMPLNFFAPHHGYGSSPKLRPAQRIPRMVKALHSSDIEVLLDVVYNHTAEGDQSGPNYCYKGIDNSTYYLMSGDPKHPYENFSGTGNTLHCSNRYVRKMIVDSLLYWAKEMHVDGFRFDLASVFARNDDGSLNLDDPPIFGDILSDPDLADIRLIAEPWDAAGAYQLGRSFPATRWFQWNGRFRDDIRRFVRGDPGLCRPSCSDSTAATISSRTTGWMRSIPTRVSTTSRPTMASPYTTSCLTSRKRNQANGLNNTDGTEENYSWNCGWEGDKKVSADVLEVRSARPRTFAACCSWRTERPCFRAGDEFLQTQGGNNNPFNQDNPTSWLDWDRLRVNQDVFCFFRSMIRFRKAHPSLGRSRFWRDDVRWFGSGPTVDMGSDSHTLAVLSARGREAGRRSLHHDQHVRPGCYLPDPRRAAPRMVAGLRHRAGEPGRLS